MFPSKFRSFERALMRTAALLLAVPALVVSGCEGGLSPTDGVADVRTPAPPSPDASAGDDASLRPPGPDVAPAGPPAAPSDRDGGGAGRAPSFPAAFLAQEPAWEPCPLAEGTPDDAACADVTVPRRWSEPDGATLTLRVLRHGADADAAVQLWLLPGGPAPALPTMGGLIRAIAGHRPDAVIYTLDHRGTGGSSWVGCPDQHALDSAAGLTIADGAEWAACLRHIAADWPPIDTFRTTEAALDVAFLAELVAAGPETQRFVYGVSYGTAWAHRVAQLAPDRFDGFVLDSVALPGAIAVDRHDVAASRVAEDLLALCVEEPACGDRLGPDPAAYARDVLAALEDGHCPALAEAGIDVPALKSLLLSMGMASEARALLAATLYRLDRCDPRDVAAVRAAWVYLHGDQVPPGPGGDSPVLREHVLLSELRGEVPRHLRDVEQDQAEHIVSSGADLLSAWAVGRWPVYATDAYHGAPAPADVPILMMNGTLDFQTTRYHQESARASLSGPHQRFVEVPWGNHGLVFDAPVRTDGAPSCGLQLLLGFLDDPLAEPADGCLADLVPPDFDGPSYLAPFVLHEADIWENLDPSLDCGLPEDLREPEGDAWLTFAFRGWIAGSGVRYGVGDFEARVAGDRWDADREGSYAAVVTTPDGEEAVALHALSRYVPLGLSARRYVLTRAVLPLRALLDWQRRGAAGRDLGAVAGATVSMLDVEERLVGERLHARVCLRAAGTVDDPTSRLRLCHAANETFGADEELQLAGRVALAPAPSPTTSCRCVVDGASVTDCAVFGGNAAKAAGAAAQVPALPPAEALPPLPPPRRRLVSRL